MNTLITKWSTSKNNCGVRNLSGWLYNEEGELIAKNKATGCGYYKPEWLEMWAEKYGKFKKLEL